MADAPLNPIVISAIVTGKFECLGDGLLHEGVEREQPNTLKDLLVPTKTSKRTPIEDRERPKKWWKAQCVHYGITVPSQAPIGTYRVHLENAIRQRGGLKRPQDIADLEFEQNAKFRRLNAEVRDATRKEEAKAPKAKSKAAKSQPEVEAAPPKAKAKAKAKAEPKPKLKPVNPDADPVAPAKPAASRKRKAETVVHIYHHDGNGNQQGSSAPTKERAKETKRPTKKARTATAPLQDHIFSDPPGYSEFDMQPSSQTSSQQFSHPALSQSIRKGIPGAFSGTYELESTSTEVRRSYQKPLLKVFVLGKGNINTSFRALLTLPDLLTCCLRLKPGAPPADDGYVRFEWCGRDDWSRETLRPRPENVGWLKMHKAEGRVKGMVKTSYGEFLFQGPRIGVEPVNMQWDWEDFDDAMDVDDY
ncbi:hypothetical protein FRC10_009497 [Ceratobasidium sp. 414]|nr:hypothetical protein FRC10_009497 [Ceratobasidium sp. 414]